MNFLALLNSLLPKPPRHLPRYIPAGGTTHVHANRKKPLRTNVPIRYQLPHPSGKYTPHQGARECARRRTALCH